MKTIDFYFDPVSPYSWLAFAQLPQALMGLSHQVRYKPVFLGALLRDSGAVAPAQIPAKRAWTYRHVLWLGHQLGVPLAMPATHPFNALPLLRLALATAGPLGEPAQDSGVVNRYVAEQVLRHVWEGGLEATDPERLAALQVRLAEHMRQRGLTLADPASEAVKARLRANSQEALAAGAFGAPSFVLEGRLFWGLDSLPMLREAASGGAWFEGPHWEATARHPDGLRPKAPPPPSPAAPLA